MLSRQDAQRIDLSGLSYHVTEIFIIHIEQWRVNVSSNTIRTHDVPLRLFVIDFDGQPVANFKVWKYVEEVVPNHNRIFVARLQPATGGDDGVDQG